MNWYLQVLKKYAVFSGRARRKEYWMFSLFNILFAGAAIVIDNLLDLTVLRLPYGVFYFVYAFAIFIPSLAVSVRRLHDVGKSGWMLFISLIPLVGGIWLLVLLVTDSEGENKYGPNPKGEDHVQQLTFENKSSDTIIILIMVWWIISRLLYLLVSVVDRYFMDTIHYLAYLNLFIGIVGAAVPVLLAFLIKDKTKRIVFLVIGAIMSITSIVQGVMSYMQMLKI